MKRVLTLVLLSLSFLSGALRAEAVASGYENEAAQARELLEKAITLYREVGEKSFAQFSRQGEFTQGGIYIYVVDASGKMLASGGPSATLIGRDISPLLDESLRQAFREVLDESPSDTLKSREYRWMNWQDNRVERKRAYYRHVDDKIFAAGYYMPRSSQAEAERLLKDAITSLEQDAITTLQRINSLDPFFNRDDLYVYVVDLESERFVAHGFQSRLIGTNFRNLTTSSGEKVGQIVLTALQGKDKADAIYGWINPTTGKREQKRALLRRSGHYLVAVGVYLQ